MTTAIFISYRRSDSEGQAGRLFRDLCDTFGRKNVLIDVVGMAKGRDFRKTIDQRLEASAVVLVVIGKTWVTSTDAAGNRRLDDPQDFVRLETSTALRKDVPVIPVLVGGATVPREAELPDDLKELSFRDGVELTHARWDYDVRALVDALKPLLGENPKERHFEAGRKSAIAALVAAGALTLAYVALSGRPEAPADNVTGTESEPVSIAVTKPAGGVAELYAAAPTAEKAARDTKTAADKFEPHKIAPDKAASVGTAVAERAVAAQATDKAAASVVLTWEATEQLNALIRKVKAEPPFDLEMVIVEGYSEGTQNGAIKYQASSKRSQIVKDFLSVNGFESNRIWTNAEGQLPKGDIRFPGVRATKNRVEIIVLGDRRSNSGTRDKVLIAGTILF